MSSEEKKDFIFPVVHAANFKVPLPPPQRDHSAPVRIGAQQVRPTDVLEGRVVRGPNGVQKILVINSNITVAVAPCEGILEVGAVLQFRVTRGMHPSTKHVFPLAVDVVPAALNPSRKSDGHTSSCKL